MTKKAYMEKRRVGGGVGFAEANRDTIPHQVYTIFTYSGQERYK